MATGTGTNGLWRREWNSNAPVNVDSTTYKATDGDFSTLRTCKTLPMAGEWQVLSELTQHFLNPAQTVVANLRQMPCLDSSVVTPALARKRKDGANPLFWPH